MAVMTVEKITFLREECLKSYSFFAASMTGKDWFDEKLHGDLCDTLQNAGELLVIILPRSFLKTTFGATLFPLWYAIKMKIEKGWDVRVLIVSNTAPNAEKTIHSIRAQVESNKLIQVLFPEIIPEFNHVRWSDRSACLARKVDLPEATFESAGVGTAIIRRHYDLIIEDDTVAPSKDSITGSEAMPTKDDIEKAIGFHRLTIPLKIDPKSARRIVIGTRWANFDLLAYIMENEKPEIFSRPDVDETGKPNYFRYDEAVLESIKIGMGQFMYSCLYKNKPMAREMMKFHPDWLMYYDELPKDGLRTVTVDSADAPTGSSRQDYTAITGCQHSNSGFYVIGYIRERLRENEVICKALDFADQIGSNEIIIEVDRYANLKFGFEDEMSRRGKWKIITPVKTRGVPKETRILGLAPIAESHCFYLKKGMNELEEEMFSFPYGRHDDILDSLAWQLVAHRIYKAEPEKKKKGEFVRMLPTAGEVFESILRKGSRVWQR